MSLTLTVPATALAAPAPVAVMASGQLAMVSDAASLVNPFIGTSGGVDTFPGTEVPFGTRKLKNLVRWALLCT